MIAIKNIFITLIRISVLLIIMSIYIVVFFSKYKYERILRMSIDDIVWRIDLFHKEIAIPFIIAFHILTLGIFIKER